MVKESQWVRVSRSEPCVVCDRPDFCTRSADGAVVHCMRIKSDKEARKGGWIHKLGDDMPRLAPVVLKKKDRPKIDWTLEAARLSMKTKTHEFVQLSEKIDELAEKLGVSADSLSKLQVGYGYDDWRKLPFWSFPMRSAGGRVIGITRRYYDGRKKTMEHSRSGLYYATSWQQSKGPVLIVEGASDTAALMTMGLCAIGRNSNVGGVELLARMLGRERSRPIMVLGECDEHPDRRGKRDECPADCTGCAYCWPGKYGAEHTARQLTELLRRKVTWRLPPAHCKDAREWLNQGGASGEAFLNQLWRP